MTTTPVAPAPTVVADRVRSARRRLILPPTLLGLAAAGATGLVVVWNPHTHHVPLCPFHAATGLWCPLCGGLRAVHDVAAGDLGRAVADNMLVFAVVPLVVAWWCWWLARARAGVPGATPDLHGSRWARPLVVATAVLVVGFTVLRNLPIGAALAP